jgi:hypothetical protein
MDNLGADTVVISQVLKGNPSSNRILYGPKKTETGVSITEKKNLRRSDNVFNRIRQYHNFINKCVVTIQLKCLNRSAHNDKLPPGPFFETVNRGKLANGTIIYQKRQ